MARNPILEEIYAVRRKLLEDAGGDLHRYVQEAAKRLRESGRAIAEPTSRESRQAKSLKLKSKPKRKTVKKRVTK